MRTVLVTGCSSGFGLDTTVTAAQAGWQVFASMRNLEKRDPLDEALKRTGMTGRVDVLQLDVTDADSIEKASGYVLEATGGTLDAVVHNAGVSIGGFFEDVSDEDTRWVMETNFFGILALTRRLLPAMRAQRQGRIVIVSSDSANTRNPGMSAYCASKWAIEGWAESLAMETSLFGVKVILVEPGAYKTSIWDNAPRVSPEGSAYKEVFDAVEPRVEEVVEKHARDPKEVADTILKALEAKRPRFRYPVGPDAVMFSAAKGVVPFSARAWIIRKFLGTPERL